MSKESGYLKREIGPSKADFFTDVTQETHRNPLILLGEPRAPNMFHRRDLWLRADDFANHSMRESPRCLLHFHADFGDGFGIRQIRQLAEQMVLHDVDQRFDPLARHADAVGD
jgi:hypothetical protein